MSVLIKGANIPVMGCLYCQLRNGDNCVASDILDVSEQVYKSTHERHPDCPLVEVPTPHGRLIDADEYGAKYIIEFDKSPLEVLESTPTIIEAEVTGNDL